MAESTFRGQYIHYLIPDSEIRQKAFASGLIVLDTNVLLNIYRFAEESRNELLDVIGQLRDRIWIPHQVGEEFYRNRIPVMASLGAGYANLLKHVNSAEGELIKLLQEKINELNNQVFLRETEKQQLIAHLNSALKPLLHAVAALRKKHELKGSYSHDPILERIEELLSGRVGSPFPDDDLEAHKKEAKRRIDDSEPPGFKDAGKHSHYYGDYFVWRQALDQAERLASSILIFVTDDKKDDWYVKVQGRRISARPELVKEALRSSGCRLIMMDVAQFLTESKKYISADVSEETIREAEILHEQESLISIANLHSHLKAAIERERRIRSEYEILHETLTRVREENSVALKGLRNFNLEDSEPEALAELQVQYAESERRLQGLEKRANSAAFELGTINGEIAALHNDLQWRSK